MIKQSLRLKILILPLSLVISIIAVIFYIKPMYSEMIETKKVLGEKKAELDKLSALNQKLQKMKAEWNTLGEDKNLVLNALPERENIDFYISELASKSNRSGIALSSVNRSQQATAATGGPAYLCGAAAAGTGAAATTASSSYIPPASSAQSAESSLGGASPIGGCVNTIPVSVAAKGSWEQMLDFFKYLEDMNRISNIKDVSISTGSAGQTSGESQEPADLLSVTVSADIFFKNKLPGGGMALASATAGFEGFNQKAIGKLKEVVFSQYSAPTVAPAGQRNIFK